MALTGLATAVTVDMIQVHFLGREIDLSASSSVSDQARESIIASVAQEVSVFVKPTAPADLQELAADAIATEVASRIEHALFPEQQVLGSEGRSYYLHQLYLDRLNLIKAHSSAARQIRPRTVVADLTGYGTPAGTHL